MILEEPAELQGRRKCILSKKNTMNNAKREEITVLGKRIWYD